MEGGWYAVRDHVERGTPLPGAAFFPLYAVYISLLFLLFCGDGFGVNMQIEANIICMHTIFDMF